MTADPQSTPAAVPDSEDSPRALAFRWNTVAVHLTRRLRRTDVSMGLPTAQASALSVLVFAGPHTITELAGFEQIATPTMTRIVTSLEQRGLAERTRDKKDGRLVRVTATPAGRDLIEQGRLRRIERLEAAFAAFTPAQRTALAEAARILMGLTTTDEQL